MGDDNQFIKLIYKRCLLSSMLAILGGALGQIASAIIVGNALGSEELSVISITLPVYYVYATAGALIGVGGTAVCARMIGKNQFDECRNAFTAVYLIMVITAAVITVFIFIFAGNITVFLGISPNAENFSKVRDYIRILSAGGIFIMSIYPAFNLLRLDGRNGATAGVFFVMAGVNILLAFVLVVFMDIGVVGVAVASVAGAGVSGTLGATILFAESKNFKFKLPGIRFIKKTAAEIIVSGSPSALENLCILSRTAAINWILAVMLKDMTSVSAFKVTDSVNSFAQIFIAGASGSMIPFIGVFASEKDTNSIRQILRLGFIWGGIMITAFTAVCFVFAEQTAGLFGMGGSGSLPAAISAIRLFALSLPIAAVNNMLVCLYQANRNTAAANILTIERSLAWILLSAFVLSPRIGAEGVWHSFWIAELAAFISAVVVSAVARHKNKYLSKLFLLDTETEVNGIYKSFSVKNSVQSVSESTLGITDFCESNSLNAKRTMAISLAIEEMLLLIIEHCFAANKNFTANVRILIWEDNIILRIRSGGKPFNPVEYYERKKLNQAQKISVSEKIDRLEIISETLGIKMILELAKTVNYQNTFGVNNMTIII